MKVSLLYKNTRFDSKHNDDSGESELVQVNGGYAWMTKSEREEYSTMKGFEKYVTQHDI
jgi:chromosome segregation and condensation protein ScpB